MRAGIITTLYLWGRTAVERRDMLPCAVSDLTLLERQLEVIRTILFVSRQRSQQSVHLFESAIDLLSYAALRKMDGEDWRGHLLSLAGVYQPAKEIEKSKIPAALARSERESAD